MHCVLFNVRGGSEGARVREPAQISRSKLGILWSLPKRAVGSERLCPAALKLANCIRL
jgi:hypothetical protein